MTVVGAFAPVAAREAVVTELLARYRPKLSRYVRRLIDDPYQVEDLVQETLLRAWLHADVLLSPGTSVEAWLYRVARNVTIDELRYRRARPVEPSAETGTRLVTADPSGHVETQIDVAAALRRLPVGHRQVVVEILLVQRSVKEVAARLGIPSGTVKSRLFYGLRRLRAALTPDGTATEVGQVRRA